MQALPGEGAGDCPRESNGRWKKSIKSDQTSCPSRSSPPIYGWEGVEVEGRPGSIFWTSKLCPLKVYKQDKLLFVEGVNERAIGLTTRSDGV